MCTSHFGLGTGVKPGDTPRSYILGRMAGGIPLKRNRVHLRPSVENWKGKTFYTDEEQSVEGGSDADLDRGPREGGDEPSDRGRTTEELESVPTSVPPSLRRSTREKKPTDFFQAGGR